MSTATPDPESGHILATTTSLSKLSVHERFGIGDVPLVLAIQRYVLRT